MKEIIDTSTLMNLSEVDNVIQVDEETGELSLSKDAMLFISQVDMLERWSKDGKKRMQAILKDKMEEYDITSLKGEDITVSYKAENERMSLNQELLKEKYHNAYLECLEVKPVKASVSIRRKK